MASCFFSRSCTACDKASVCRYEHAQPHLRLDQFGGTFTLSGPTTAGSVEFIVTNIAKSDPIDGILTYTVSGSRSADQT